MAKRIKIHQDSTPQQVKDYWRDKPDLVKKFIEAREDYQCLCDEVKYVLSKRINENNIEVSTVIARAKTLNSFLEKINRKNYKDYLFLK